MTISLKASDFRRGMERTARAIIDAEFGPGAYDRDEADPAVAAIMKEARDGHVKAMVDGGLAVDDEQTLMGTLLER